MILDEISIVTIELIVDEIRSNNFDCNSLLGSFKKGIEYHNLNDEYTKIVVRDMSKTINVTVMDCKNDKIQSISFYGSISITPIALLEKYKQYREAYSARDDLYFYFFNEDKLIGDYRISFFDSPNNRISVNNNPTNLSNLTIDWK